MSGSHTGHTRTSSVSGRAVTGVRWDGLRLLVISALAAFTAAACVGGEGRGQADSIRIFPQHNAPLGTDNGGQYFAGKLALNKGCLRGEIPSDGTDSTGVSRLLIWPVGFALNAKDGAVRIADGNGRIAAHVGDYIRLSRATASYQEARDQGLIQGISEDCAGPYYLVGDEVSAFDPNNEPTELGLSDPDILFLRQRTVIASSRELLTAAGIGELILDGQCLRLKGSTTTIVWPAGFTPHAHNDLVHVRNGAGRIIAQVGDEISMGGGYSTRYDNEECPGGVFSANSIKVLPDVEVYFPKQDGTLGTDQEMERFVGKLVLDGKCLEVDTAFRVRDRVIVPGGRRLVIWPDTFTLNLEEEAVGIVDATGHIVARVGDAVQFSAFSVTYQQALEHSGLQEIAPACGGPEWVIGEDFAAVPDTESP